MSFFASNFPSYKRRGFSIIERRLTVDCRWMGDRYEVVRVQIEYDDGATVEGCCFAFYGEENQLEELG